MTAPRPRSRRTSRSSGSRGMDNGPGLMALGGHVAGAARPLVRVEPRLHKPRKMRVVIARGAPADAVASLGSGLTKGPSRTERESLTTGTANRNGRGLTSGWGMVNGTGMVRESEFHVKVGRFNGSCVTYRSAALGSRDGMTNGSGLTEAGLAGDAGLTNGCGLTHGVGMTNGCGLVRPMDPAAPMAAPRPERRRGLRAIIGI